MSDINWREVQKRVERNARRENARSGRVQTPDGLGTVLGMDMRQNTNGGPGTRQWRVRPNDGRIRHYPAAKLTEQE